MRKIAIYPNGVGIIDTDSPHVIKINGEEYIRLVDITDETMAQYFPNLGEKEPEIKI